MDDGQLTVDNGTSAESRRAMADEIKRWCSTDEDRRKLLDPWTIGEWTYATDGRAAIKVPAGLSSVRYNRGTPEEGRVPNLDAAIAFSPAVIACWVPLPVVERVDEMMQCPDCDGTGKGPEVECDGCCHTHRCGCCVHCDGQRSRLQPLPVVTGSGLIAWHYYERLRALPGVEIGVLSRWGCLKDSRVHFRFQGGGSGLVMGMKWEGNGGRAAEATRAVLAIRAELGLAAPVSGLREILG